MYGSNCQSHGGRFCTGCMLSKAKLLSFNSTVFEVHIGVLDELCFTMINPKVHWTRYAGRLVDTTIHSCPSFES